MKKQQAGALWNYLPAWAQRFRRLPATHPSALPLQNNGPRSTQVSVAPLPVETTEATTFFRNTPQLPPDYPRERPVMERRPRWNIFDITRKRRQRQHQEALRQWEARRFAVRARPGIEETEQRIRNIERTANKNNARARRFMNQYERALSLRQSFPQTIRHYANVPDEDIASAKQRGLIFFYNQMHTKSEDPGKGEEFEEGFVPVDYNIQSKLTDEQREELREALRRINYEDTELDDIAETIFHLPLRELDDKLKEFELGKRDSYLRRLEEPLEVLYEFTDREVKPKPWGSYLARYMSTFFMTPRDFAIQKDVRSQAYKCAIRITPDVSKPITNLQETRNSMPTSCIILFSGLQNLEYYLRGRELSTQVFDHPFLIVDYSKLDITYFSLHSTPYTVEPEHLLEDAILRDAFANNAVIGIEPHLEVVLARENPGLIQNKERFITLFSPKYTNYLNLLRFANGGRNARVDELRFMILDFELPHNAELYALYPNILQDRYIQEQPNGILLCDAITLYKLRRDRLENPDLQALYTKSFHDPNLETYQNTLNDLQKLVFCYVQYSQTLYIFNKFMREYGERLANALKNNNVKANTIIEYVLRMMKETYNADVSQDSISRELFAPFENPQSPFWPGLLRLQERYFPRNVSHLRRPEDIRLLLAAFQPGTAANTLPFRRLENVVEQGVREEIAAAAAAAAETATATTTSRGQRVAALRRRYEPQTRQSSLPPSPYITPDGTPSQPRSRTPVTSRSASQGGKQRKTRRRRYSLDRRH